MASIDQIEKNWHLTILRFPLSEHGRSVYLFSSLIHFEVIFLKGVKSLSKFLFFFLHVNVQLYQSFFLKDCHLSILLPLLFRQTSVYYMSGFIFGFSSLFHWSVCLFFPQYHTILDGGMAKVLEHLPSMCKALSSYPIATAKKEKRKKNLYMTSLFWLL
jgi:hypothetical protein